MHTSSIHPAMNGLVYETGEMRKMCIQKCLQTLFLLLQIHQNIDCGVILIKPRPNTPCPQGRPCSTLTQYANNPSTGLQITLMFLPGTHVLNITLSVANKERFIMMASSTSDFPQLACTSTGNLSLSFIQAMLINGISFSGCGHNEARVMGSFTMQYSSFVNSTAMHNGAVWSVSSSTTVVIENCTFANNIVQRGGTLNVNMVLNLTVVMSMFENNKIAQEFNDGGALLITETNSYISLSAFSHNQVRRGGDGGAVYINRGNTTVSYSTFTNNQVNGSSGEGGALYVYRGNLTICECTFANNQVNGSSGLGGALYIWGTITAKINDSKFMNNRAYRNGGAVYIWGTSSMIRESMFVSNEVRGSSGQGGALYINRAYSTEIIASNFTENQVSGIYGYGGAIYVSNAWSTIYNCNFASNQVDGSNGDGGAVHIRDSNSAIYDSIFTNNQVIGRFGEGGAIYIIDANSTIMNSIFINNQVGDPSGEGGALYFKLSTPSSSSFLSLKLCILKKNRAGLSETSGVVHVQARSYWYKGTLSISHCQFFENSGEAVYTYNVSKLSIHSSDFEDYSNARASLISESPIRRSSHGEMLINQSRFTGNTRAIESINIRHIKICSSNFSNNTGNKREGGAIFATGKSINALLSHNTFSKITAASCGVLSVGSVNHDSTRQMYDVKVSLFSNIFSSNSATDKNSRGGVACFRNAMVTIDDCSFSGNSANSEGGTFHANESFITIERSTFVNNAAFNDGGIGHVVNSSLVVRDSTFNNNSALNVGGVFAIKNGLVAIDSNTFHSNRAVGGGEIVYFYSDLDDSIFLKLEENRFLDNGIVEHRRVVLARNYSIEYYDDLFQTSCVCYCSTAYVISRTFAAARDSNNCTVCSLLNDKFAEIAQCSADYNKDFSSSTSPDIGQEQVNIVASSISVVVFLIATMAVVAAIILIHRSSRRTKAYSLPGCMSILKNKTTGVDVGTHHHGTRQSKVPQSNLKKCTQHPEKHLSEILRIQASIPALRTRTSPSSQIKSEDLSPGFGDCPTMPKMLEFHIPLEVGAGYHDFGTYLLQDDTGARISTLKYNHRHSCEAINREILQMWLGGVGLQPKTWATLIKVLEKSGKSELGLKIKKELGSNH